MNIGLELVSKPSLLFMDEPTSGLDATAATDILTALKRQAKPSPCRSHAHPLLLLLLLLSQHIKVCVTHVPVAAMSCGNLFGPFEPKFSRHLCID